MAYKKKESQRKYYRELYAKSPSRRKMVQEAHKRSVQRFVRIVSAYKIYFGCADCGYRENAVALDFDHLNAKEKLFGVSDMIRRSGSLLKIFFEIFKCEVRCANCHRIKHASAVRPVERA